MHLKRLLFVPAAAGVLVLTGMSSASAGEAQGNSSAGTSTRPGCAATPARSAASRARTRSGSSTRPTPTTSPVGCRAGARSPRRCERSWPPRVSTLATPATATPASSPVVVAKGPDRHTCQPARRSPRTPRARLAEWLGARESLRQHPHRIPGDCARRAVSSVGRNTTKRGKNALRLRPKNVPRASDWARRITWRALSLKRCMGISA